jgi:hypothetical protein
MFHKYWLVNELCPVAKLIYFSFVHLGITLILVLGSYSGLSGRVRTVYLFSLCVNVKTIVLWCIRACNLVDH